MTIGQNFSINEEIHFGGDSLCPYYNWHFQNKSLISELVGLSNFSHFPPTVSHEFFILESCSLAVMWEAAVEERNEARVHVKLH